MINMCCYEYLLEPDFNWDSVTAIGTIALAIVTIPLAFYAGRQFKDVNEFNKKNVNLSQLQSAESLILKQIEFHYNILGRIEKYDKSIFNVIYENLIANFEFDLKKSIPEMEFQVKLAYGKLYVDFGYILGHYFRNLYRIFKNIDEINVDGFDKKYYAKLVRAQFSEYETLLLFYNCIWINDNKKFKNLVEKYELLEGTNFDLLIDSENHPNLYIDNAFGDEFL